MVIALIKNFKKFLIIKTKYKVVIFTVVDSSFRTIIDIIPHYYILIYCINYV